MSIEGYVLLGVSLLEPILMESTLCGELMWSVRAVTLVDSWLVSSGWTSVKLLRLVFRVAADVHVAYVYCLLFACVVLFGRR